MNRLTAFAAIFVFLIISFLSANSYAKTISYVGDKAVAYARAHCGTGTLPDEGYNPDYVCWDGDREQCREDHPDISADFETELPWTYFDKDGNIASINTPCVKTEKIDGQVYFVPDENGDIQPKNCRKDCANYASQALIDGGINFNDISEKYGATTIGKENSDRAGAKGIVSVSSLLRALKDTSCFEIVTADKAKAGDIVITNNGGHVAIVGDPEAKTLYGHTNDRCGEFTYLPGATILHFSDDDKCKKCERDEETNLAKLVDKASPCESCDTATGELTSMCDGWVGSGQCASSQNCEVVAMLDTGSIYGYYYTTYFCRSTPSGDCPDDTFSVGTGVTAQPEPSTNPYATVGILENGYTYDMHGLLESFGEQTRIVNASDISPSLVGEMPLLVIPTAGLNGMDNSDFFKAVMDEYVKQGGSLLVLSQQHGQEYSILPGGLGGYGWAEDQSCQVNSSYIDTWHPVLAGQTRSTPSLNVDGYFTQYPEDSTVLLRRTKNGQPAVIMYPHGQGYVIATTIYTDTAYTRGEASADERQLIRDMVTWAKAPASLPEIGTTDTASVNLMVTNYDDTETATAAEIEIYNPDRNERLSWASVPVSIAPGQSAQIPVVYNSTGTARGIYHVKYNLMAEGYQLLTSEIDPVSADSWLPYQLQAPIEESSGRFAVSSPPADTYEEREFNVTVNSDSEKYSSGSDAVFAITVWNNSDEDKTVTLKVSGAHLYANFIEEVTIPANSLITRQAIAQDVNHQGWLFARVFEDMNHIPVATAGKGIWVFSPSVNLEVQTDNTYYSKGDTVNLTLGLTNKQDSAYASTVKVNVSDPSNLSIYSTEFDADLAAGGTYIENLSFVLNSTAATAGFYSVSVEAYDTNGNKIGGDSVGFESPLSWISVTPDISSPLAEGISNIPLALKNLGGVDVTSGVLDVDFRDPEGEVLYSGSLPFALAVGDSVTLDVPLNISSLTFGDYTLTYAQSDETKEGQPSSVVIPNAADLNVAFDRVSYRIRESANLTVDVADTGRFDLENASVTVSAPDVEYTDSKAVQLTANSIASFEYAIAIPDTASAGQYVVNVTLALPSGSSITKTAKLTIPESSLEIGYYGSTSVAAGDSINLTLENTGGVDTSYTTEKLYIKDDKGTVIYNGSAAGAIIAGEKKTLADIQLPAQAADGQSYLYVMVTDGGTEAISLLNRSLEITGLTAGLSAHTDQSAYLDTEEVTALSTLSNGDFDIDNGTLELTVSKYEKPSTGGFTYFINEANLFTGGSGDGQFYVPYDVAVGPDGYIYVADTGNHRIQKFDSFGNFITKWGSYCMMYQQGYSDYIPDDECNEQFNTPHSIAVDPDGHIYVADTENHRIQIYESDGTFITSWGSKGEGIGKFFSPMGIAVGPDEDAPGGYAVYVADTANKRIQKFDRDGTFITKWGSWGRGDGQFRSIYAVAVGPDGSVYSAEHDNNRIEKFTSDGTFLLKWGSWGWDDGQFRFPVGVAVSPDNYVYVSETLSFRIKKFDDDGIFQAKWGSDGYGEGHFKHPGGVTVGPDGTVYVADTDNNRIQRMIVSQGGDVTLFETTIPVTQAANTTEEYTTDIGTLDATGKLYLHATLKNELGQTIAKDLYPFYIVEGDTVLLFNTDKKIYRPGETVSITGEVRNLASIAVTGLTVNIEQGAESIYTSTFVVPAGGSQPFTFTTTASDEGTYMLTGTVTQNGSTLVEILDQYEVANPVVSATVTAPDVVGNEPFDITVEIKNDGKGDTSVTLQSSIDGMAHDIAIPAGEMRAIQYSGQITASTTYTFTFTGDLEQTITKTVEYGLGAAITVSPEAVYPEGRVGIPVTVFNMGTFDEALDVAYTLEPGGITEARAYYIPADTSVSDTLYYELPEGEYTISAESQLPNASANASFSVKKENNVLMAMAVGLQTGELIPVGVDLTNLGYNAIEGSLRYALSGSEGEAWSGEQAVTALLPDEARAMSFDVDPSALAPGDYSLSVILIDNSGQTIAASSAPLTVHGPVFEITQLPPYQTFQPGQVAEMTFTVRNIGNVEGAVELALSAYDLIDTSQREWLGPNEERSFTFGFMLPDDLEDKDYFADYELLDEDGTLITSGQVKYHLAGINITVDASLDKQYYLEGETAHLTLNVQSQSTATLPLFARVNYAGYEAEQVFTLDENQTLAFDVPLAEITGEKLFYGIYYESGRSIHLNSLYIHEDGDELTIITDKQVYEPGETVAFTITSEQYSGTLTVSSLDYSATMSLSGSVTDSFTLPAEMTAGTYTIRATLATDSGETFTAAYPFDVAGMQVKVLECVNDKGKYALSDTITTNYTISSNTEIPATLKTWIVDPEGRYTPSGEEAITLTSEENLLFTGQTALETEIAGIHRLVYGIYRGNLLLVSGSESFDVGDAVLLGLSTDKSDYPTNSEPVVVTASMFGTAGANLELLIDDVPIQSQQVALNGFVNTDIDLGTVEPGVHTLKGILTAGGLKSTKETGFVYGSTLPDLTVRGSYAAEVSKENTMELSFTVTNSGKTPAAPSVLTLYSGDEPIETIAVSELQPEESAEYTVNLNVLGKSGEYGITAVADADESVVEFNEKNNETSLTVKVPELTLFSSTGLPEYRIRENADIIADITNLSAEAINGYRLRTVVTSPLGTVAFEEVTDMPELTAETLTTMTTVWSIPDSAEEGMHEVLQQVLNADGEVVAASSASVEVLASDFILSIDPVSFDLRQGEDAVVSGSIEPLGIFDSEVSLLVEGLPEGASHVLNPCTVAVPGEFTLKVLTNQETVAGTYQIKITAEGDDIIHEAVFDISISAFELKVETDTANIEQLETASFALDVNSLNGYEGDVTLDISGVPHGMQASFGNADVTVPDSVTLDVLTSKYAIPGEYVLTVSASDELVTHSQELTVKVLANPAIAKGIIVTQGPGPKNEAWVRALGKDLSPAMEIMAFDTKYGAYAASADIDGDGYDEIIAAQGPDPKNKAVLRAIGRDGNLMAEYQAFDANYGLTVSAGDLDGDWTDELVVGMGPDPKNPTMLKVLKYAGGTFSVLSGVEAYENLKYGINIAVGDVDGDNMPEIVTVPGPDPKNLAIVKVWEYDGQAVNEVGQFYVFDTKYGATVATGDTDGDGAAEILVGTGPDPKNMAVVRIFEADGEFVGEYWPYGEDYGYGVNVAAVDLNGDGIDELITGLGPGPQNQPWLKVLAIDGSELASYLAYPENTKYGLRVCPARPGVATGD